MRQGVSDLCCAGAPCTAASRAPSHPYPTLTPAPAARRLTLSPQPIPPASWQRWGWKAPAKAMWERAVALDPRGAYLAKSNLATAECAAGRLDKSHALMQEVRLWPAWTGPPSRTSRPVNPSLPCRVRYARLDGSARGASRHLNPLARPVEGDRGGRGGQRHAHRLHFDRTAASGGRPDHHRVRRTRPRSAHAVPRQRARAPPRAAAGSVPFQAPI